MEVCQSCGQPLPEPKPAEPETRQDILDAMELMGKREKKAARRSIAHLPSMLLDDEKVERIVEGFYMTGTALSATNTGGGGSILVATDRRLIFLYKGWFKDASEDYRYAQISSIQCESGFATSKITVRSGEGKTKISSVVKEQAQSFANLVSGRLNT